MLIQVERIKIILQEGKRQKQKALIFSVIMFFLFSLQVSIGVCEERREGLDLWILTTDSYENHYRTYLGNGYMGIKIPVEGTGWIAKREELPSTAIAGIYDALDCAPKGPKIVNIPSWTNIGFNDGRAYFDSRTGSIDEFFQKLNMRDGYAQTRIKWNNEGKITELNITVFVSRDRPHIGVVRYSIVPHWNGTAYFSSTIDGNFSTQYEEQIKGREKAWNVKIGILSSIFP